jgi:hypothetical protein
MPCGPIGPKLLLKKEGAKIIITPFVKAKDDQNGVMIWLKS